MPIATASTPPMAGPTAGPSRCAVCTVPMALAMRSRGAACAAIETASAPYPAKKPCSTRKPKMCHGRVTSPISTIVITKQTSDRSTRNLVP